MNKNKFESTLKFTQKTRMTKRKNYGLLEGETGIAVIYYVLARAFNNKEYELHGRNLLEYISENSESINKLNFGQGFIGIGWAIEWLIQNEYITDIDSDEILLSIDQECYKSISFSKLEDCSLFTGLLGNIQYFERRLLSQNSSTNRYRYLVNLETFVFLTDDLESTLINEKNVFNDHLFTEGRLSLANLGIILTTCSSAMQLNVNKSILENILYQGVKYSDHVLLTAIELNDYDSKKDKNRLLDCLYLAIMYSIAAGNYSHKIWRNTSGNYIEILVNKVLNFTYTGKKLLFKKMSVLCILYAKEPNPKYRDAILDCLKHLSREDQSMNFYIGTGNLVLAELCLNKPEVVCNWHELFLIE